VNWELTSPRIAMLPAVSGPRTIQGNERVFGGVSIVAPNFRSAS